MANTWDLTDLQLTTMLGLWRDGDPGGPFELRLYQNDFAPAPGMVLGDFTECDFPGYGGFVFALTTLDEDGVEAHVAFVRATVPAAFEANPVGFVSQNIYGYYVVDLSGDLRWAERFAETRVIHPSEALDVFYGMRLRTFPF